MDIWKIEMKRNKVAIKHGFRSGLEDNINESLKKSKKKYGYETEKISYIQPETKHNYTPDFILNKKDGQKMYVESKGRWVMADRLKFDLIFNQYPSIDIPHLLVLLLLFPLFVGGCLPR